MIEKIADDLIGQMTEARLIDKEMEARYVYVFICWIEKFITVGSIIVISLMFHKLLPTIFFLVFLLLKTQEKSDYPLKHSIYQHFQGNKHINLLLIYY